MTVIIVAVSLIIACILAWFLLGTVTAPYETQLEPKKCPICKTQLHSESYQITKGLFTKKVINENIIACQNCGYKEIIIKEYQPKTIEIINQKQSTFSTQKSKEGKE